MSSGGRAPAFESGTLEAASFECLAEPRNELVAGSAEDAIEGPTRVPTTSLPPPGSPLECLVACSSFLKERCIELNVNSCHKCDEWRELRVTNRRYSVLGHSRPERLSCARATRSRTTRLSLNSGVNLFPEEDLTGEEGGDSSIELDKNHLMFPPRIIDTATPDINSVRKSCRKRKKSPSENQLCWTKEEFDVAAHENNFATLTKALPIRVTPVVDAINNGSPIDAEQILHC